MKKIIDCETGEVIERELTQEELAQQIADQEEININKLKRETLAQAKIAAEEKLSKLGLSIDDLRALGL